MVQRAPISPQRRPTPVRLPGCSAVSLEGVNGETLQIVRDMLQEHDTREARRRAVAGSLKALAGRIPTYRQGEPQTDPDGDRRRDQPRHLDRMAAFLQNADDQQTPDSEKLALAVSGWLLGADAATVKLPLAISAYKVRGFLREYLRGRPAAEREQLFRLHQGRAGRRPGDRGGPVGPHEAAAGLARAGGRAAGLLRAPGAELAKEPPVTYYVQLPPEYDPYRLYPAIVTLSAEVTTAQQQIDWWAGPAVKGGPRPARRPAKAISSLRRSGPSSGKTSTAIRPASTPPC